MLTWLSCCGRAFGRRFGDTDVGIENTRNRETSFQHSSTNDYLTHEKWDMYNHKRQAFKRGKN